MLEIKKKALSGIREMLNDRMANKLKPKPSVEVEISSEGEEEKPEGTEIHESGMEGGEYSEGQPNIEALSSEEQTQLEELLNKIGC